MSMPHWLACRWSKWELYTARFTRKANVIYGVAVPLEAPIKYSEYHEHRRCETCGATQDRMIR